jgi:hypothetical protein
MKCPHCQTHFHDKPKSDLLAQDGSGVWGTLTRICPQCLKIVIEIVCAEKYMGPGRGNYFHNVSQRFLGYPRAPNRPAPPPEVPRGFSDDYIEAALVLTDSPKASAALSRRCLQHILREKADVGPSSLAAEIDEILSRKMLPAHLAEAIDAIRNIGNFAAHPIKSTTSGEIVPVEPGEAEWNLDVLDGLFDFFFVQPKILKKRRAALDAKLSAAGKPATK